MSFYYTFIYMVCSSQETRFEKYTKSREFQAKLKHIVEKIYSAQHILDEIASPGQHDDEFLPVPTSSLKILFFKLVVWQGETVHQQSVWAADETLCEMTKAPEWYLTCSCCFDRAKCVLVGFQGDFFKWGLTKNVFLPI